MSSIRKRSIRRFCGLIAALVAAFAALPSIAMAQGGRVTGVVTGQDNRPVADAQVILVNTGYRAITSANGSFTITGVPAGRYELRVARLGEIPRTIVIDVGSGETLANVQMTRAAIDLGGVTVSASRRAEKVTEAPATVTVINTDALDATVGNTYAGALKEAKGLDFIQVGMTAVAINARGFNSAFNNRFLMVEDGRIAVLPENGLPVGSFTPTPKVDIAGMEVLVGPGSALYGPDASNGVLSLTTKDPRQFPGATIEATGGSRSYRDIQGRYAGVFADGKLGFKVAGEYQAANDWENFLSYNAGGSIVPAGTTGSIREDALKVPIDWDAGVRRGTAALVYYSGANRLEVNGGMSSTDGVGQTNVGRNQLKDWAYNVLQAKFTSPRWFLNVYRTQSQSGESFALNRYAGAQLAPANASLSADSLRLLSDWPSDGRMYAAEAQGNYTVKPLLNTSFVFGAQYRRDQVSSDRQWLTDRITREDIKNDQKGVYAQSTTPVNKYLDVVLAGRLDYPENYEEQFSPKAGVIFKPMTDHAFRVTFNRAYKSPTILQTDFFIPDWTSIISIYGNTTGFQMTKADGSVVATYAAMKPETNKTLELGYKGVIVNRLYVDGTFFRSDYKNFMSPLTIIGNPFASAAAGGPTFAKPLSNPNGIPVNASGQIVTQAATPITPIVLTYYNLGDAKVSGVDLGLSAIVTNRIEVRGTASTVKIDEVEIPAGGSLEAVSLNSPTTKWTLGASARDFGPISGGLTWRNVNGYYFRSGTNTGVIPTFGTLDMNISAKVPRIDNALVNLSVGNLFTCSALNVTYEPVSTAFPQPNQRIATEDRKCGFDRKHREMINMPEIGMMAFLGVRFNVNPTFR
jgi:outer membrane receptor for ferrienterochelin and colicins